MHLFLYFLSGLIAANGIPHFIKGITGERHQTPFSNPSSAITNVIWGMINFVVAFGLWRYAKFDTGHLYRYIVAFGIGVFLTAIFLAYKWSHNSLAKSKKK